MKEPTLFKVRLLEQMAYNDIGDILRIKFIDEKGNVYYYDSEHRWCYLTPKDKWEKIGENK